jgi:uncharacterized YigZ family protein
MILKPYKTLLKAAESEFIINKSRFIGQAAPVQSEEEALAFLSDVRARHPGANHNCYAYIIGANMGVMRYNDDGEPGGTAGMPIIEVMKAREVTNCAVVVTRYFGGILLGAGGLTRAYAQGSTAAINAAGVGVMHPSARLLMDVEYPLLNKVEYYLKSAPCLVEEKNFSEVITFSLLVKQTDEAQLVEALTALSDGRLEPLRFDEMYMAWPES